MYGIVAGGANGSVVEKVLLLWLCVLCFPFTFTAQRTHSYLTPTVEIWEFIDDGQDTSMNMLTCLVCQCLFSRGDVRSVSVK